MSAGITTACAPSARASAAAASSPRSPRAVSATSAPRQCERPRGCEADAAGCAGDEDALALEIRHGRGCTRPPRRGARPGASPLPPVRDRSSDRDAGLGAARASCPCRAWRGARWRPACPCGARPCGGCRLRRPCAPSSFGGLVAGSSPATGARVGLDLVDDAEGVGVGRAAPSALRGLPATTPMPISRYSGLRMFCRWPGEFIHACMIEPGVASGPVPQARFSPIAQPRVARAGSRRRRAGCGSSSRRGPCGRSSCRRRGRARRRSRRRRAWRRASSGGRPASARTPLSRQSCDAAIAAQRRGRRGQRLVRAAGAGADAVAALAVGVARGRPGGRRARAPRCRRRGARSSRRRAGRRSSRRRAAPVTGCSVVPGPSGSGAGAAGSSEAPQPAARRAEAARARSVERAAIYPGHRPHPRGNLTGSGPQWTRQPVVQLPAPSASNAATHTGSNCEPAPARISPAASSTVQASL